MKEKKEWQEIMKKSLLVLLALLTLYMLFCFFFAHPSLSPVQCAFPAGFTCIKHNFHPDSGELDLNIGQGIGKTIRITGLACTNYNVSENYRPANVNNYANDPIIMNSGEAKTISQSGTSHVVKCVDANGKLISEEVLWAGYGDRGYQGRLYINYTEIDTNVTGTVKGLFVQIIRSCWEKHPCSCLGGITGAILLPLLILAWLIVGFYFFSESKQS